MTVQGICELCALFEDHYDVGQVGRWQVAVRLPYVPWWAFGRKALRRRLKAMLMHHKPATLELIFQERFFE